MPPSGPPAEPGPPAPAPRSAGPAWPPSWTEAPGNPRTSPRRTLQEVEAAVRTAEAQRAELEAMMTRSGQGDALLVAPLEAVVGAQGGAFTSTTWIEGRICVLAPADLVVLFEQPAFVGADPVVTRVRWDVVARVCGADCWNTLPGVDPPRVVTRRWPTVAHLEVLRDLSVLDAPST